MISRFLPYRLRHRLLAARHDRAAAGVLATPPLVPRADGVVLFSMIGTRSLLPYLVAIKSLHRQLRRGRVAVLDDGTLTAADRQTLAHHCGNPQLFAIDRVDCGAFPHGGTWERLLTILDHRDEYWLQLDSDTVTIGPIPEVAAAIAANRAFTLLGGPEAEVGALGFAEYAARFWPAGTSPGDHIQLRVEAGLGAAAGSGAWRYIRGCSGFAGFPAGHGSRALAADFLEVIRGAIGPAGLQRWGSEQIASNMVIANAPDPLLLPYARYSNYWAEPWGTDTRFVHFVGSHRHDHGAYAAATRAAIAALRGETPAPGEIAP